MEPLNRVVTGVVRSLLARAPMSEGKFEFAWRMAVGPSLERVTKPRLCEDGTVEVVVDGTAWRKEVRRAQPLILSRLQELLGASVARRIKVVSGR